MRTRVKICGITRPEDAVSAAQLGADAIGLVFYPPSRRALTLEQACRVNKAIPAFVTRVALFLDPEPDQVRSVVDSIRPDLLQFHGSETAEFCTGFGLPYIKALAMGDASVQALDLEQREHVAALGFLLDSHKKGQAGGSGESFDWTRLPDLIHRPIVLAGGLNPDNVAQAIRSTHPYAVDVSSGVESAPGIKDAEKMRSFLQQVRQADGV